MLHVVDLIARSEDQRVCAVSLADEHHKVGAVRFVQRRCQSDERMSRVEALKSYTINGAHAAFEERSRGSLKAGKYADLVVLSKDILTMPEDQIPTAEVRYTIVGGKIKYKK